MSTINESGTGIEAIEVPPNPVLEEIAADECIGLIAGKSVGRLVIVVADEPDVFPVNYIVDGTDVVFRTAYGLKLMHSHLQRIAFEVDDFDEVRHEGGALCSAALVKRSPTNLSAVPPTRVTSSSGRGGQAPRIDGFAWSADRHGTSHPPPLVGRTLPATTGAAAMTLATFHDRLWRLHPTVKTGDQLARGERAADRMKAALATWRALIAMGVFIVAWMLWNSHISGTDHHSIPIRGSC